MGLKPILITSDIYQKSIKALEEINSISRAAIRLKAIISAKEHGVSITAKVFNISSNTLRSWVKSFSQEGVAGLNYKNGRGRKSSLTEEHCKEIAIWVKDDCNITIAKIVDKMKNIYHIQTSKSSVHRALHKMNLSYITPRPKHYKQNKNDRDEFKKNFKN